MDIGTVIGLLAGGMLTCIGVVGLTICGWRESSRHAHRLALDNQRLCENLHYERNISHELRAKLDRLGALADELRGIDREDD